MNPTFSGLRLCIVAAIAVLALLGTSCATRIHADATMNPPPAEAFSAFNSFELKPVTLQPPYAGQAPNERALIKIQENVNASMNATLATWNSASAKGQPPRTLVIEPTITEIKFIAVGVRLVAGVFPGSSAVILRATLTEKETGRVIATPQFYARGNTWAGNFTFGVTDNLMLTRVAKRFTDYLQGNYVRALGGATGAEPKSR